MNKKLFRPIFINPHDGEILREKRSNWEITCTVRASEYQLKLFGKTATEAYERCVAFGIPVESSNFRWYKTKPDIMIVRDGDLVYPNIGEE